MIWILESGFLWGLYVLKFSEEIVLGNILLVISMIVELGSTTIFKKK